MLVTEVQRHRGGDITDADLQRVAVADEFARDERADDLRGGDHLVGARRDRRLAIVGCRMVDERGDLGDVKEVFAIGADEALIDLADNLLCGGTGGAVDPERTAVAHVAVLVGGRSLDHGDVHVLEQPEDVGLAKTADGLVIGHAGVHLLAVGQRRERRDEAEVPLRLRRRPEEGRDVVVDADVFEFGVASV